MHMKTEVLGGLRQVFSVVDIKDLLRVSAAGSGGPMIDPGIRLSYFFLVGQDMPVKFLQNWIAIHHMLEVHRVRIRHQHQAFLTVNALHKPYHRSNGSKNVVPDGSELAERHFEPEAALDLEIKFTRTDLAAVVKHFQTRVNEKISNFFRASSAILGKAAESRVKIKTQEHLSEVKNDRLDYFMVFFLSWHAAYYNSPSKLLKTF